MLPEDYNASLEQELILEQRKYEDRINRPINEDKVYSTHDHYETNHSRKIHEGRINSGYNHMLNSCQLDGLSTLGEDKEEVVLIESYLDGNDVQKAKEQALVLLTEDEDVIPADEDAITARDLPLRRVFVD